MHKIQEILEEFVTALKPLSINGVAFSVERFRPDTVNKYPTVRVKMGPETNTEDSFESDLHNLTVYTDVYIESKSTEIENDAIESRKIIEDALNNSIRFNIPEVQYVRFIDQEEPTWNNEESDDYAMMLRITWQATYEHPVSY